MLSVRDTAIAAQKVTLEFEQCSCSVPLLLSYTVLFLYDQVADFLPRETSGVVTTLTGITVLNVHSWYRTYIVSLLCVHELHGVQCNMGCLNWSNIIQIMKHDVSVSRWECSPLVTAINFINIMVFGLRQCLRFWNSHKIFFICISTKLCLGFTNSC